MISKFYTIISNKLWDFSLYLGDLYNRWVLASQQKALGPCKYAVISSNANIKWPFFSLVVFGQIQPGKIVLWYSGKKRILVRREKSTFKKVQKIETFSKWLVHGFWPKMVIFLIWGFLANPVRKGRFLMF